MNKKLYKLCRTLVLGCLLVGLISVTDPTMAALSLLYDQEGDVLNPTGITFDGAVDEGSFRNLQLEYGNMQITVRYVDGSRSYMTQHHCSFRGRTTIPGLVYIKSSNEAERSKYRQELATLASSCSTWNNRWPENKPRGKAVSWDLWVEDGWRNTSNRSIWEFNRLELPAQADKGCSTSVIENISFGVLGLGDSVNTSSGRLSAVCTSMADVSVSVNNNMVLENADGSVISFDRVQNSAVTPGAPTIISITAHLVKGPLHPGSYLWSAPVLVTYD